MQALSDAAWVEAMLEVEAALASAAGRAGAVDPAAAQSVVHACGAIDVDLAQLVRDSLPSGNPVVPLVAQLRRAVPDDAVAAVHVGATSQDVVDTSLVLVLRRALTLVLADVSRVEKATAALAKSYAGTAMVGRTLGRHAVPTTFGLKAAGWLVGVAEARVRLSRAFEGASVVQFGGAAGTLASLGTAGLEVSRLVAAELSLREPPLPWHAARTPLVDLGCSAAVLAGALGKVAVDVILLCQDEIAEVREGTAGRGGSSAMPHKRNPVGSVLALAAVRRAPGLVATLLSVMPQEHERGTGGWHAEWEVLRELVALTATAAASVAEVLESLDVDADRMAHNLSASGGLPLAERLVVELTPRIGHRVARSVVESACRRRNEPGGLAAALGADPAVAATVTQPELEDWLHPERYLGSARQLIDRALAWHAGLNEEPR